MNTIESRKATILRNIAAEGRKRAGKRPRALIETFLNAFYANVAIQELSERSAGELASIALANFDNAAQRKPGRTNIRVHNIEDSADTLVEIATDDMPFLIDSASAALARSGTVATLLVHPILRVRRDSTGRLIEIANSGVGSTARAESIVTFAIARQENAAKHNEIADALAHAYADVRAAVEDWPAMREEVQTIIRDLKLRFAEGNTGDVAEAQDFLQWAHDNHFTFLGYREYDFAGSGKESKVRVDPKKGLGILRDPHRLVFNELRHLGSMPADVQAFVRRRDPLIVSKADAKSTVHRAVTLDTIGVKKFDAKGRVIGERLIVGLFTSTAYSASPRTIPLLRRKIDKVFARTGFATASHDGKALQHILDTFPRDELFQIRDNDLFDIALGVLHTQDRQRVALFTRFDDFLRYASCFVYVPRERYSYDLRQRVQVILERAFGGEMLGYNTEYGETPLARIELTISLAHRRKPDIDPKELESQIAHASRSWSDNLRQALLSKHNPVKAEELAQTFADAFPASYTDRTSAEHAIYDVANLADAIAADRLAMDLYRPGDAKPGELRFKVYHPDRPLPLSDVLPMLEHMGLKVIDNIEFRVKRYTDQGVPLALARRIAYAILLISAPDIVRTDAASKKTLTEIAQLYFQIGETFGLGWLRYCAEKLPADTHWQKLAAAAVIEELYAQQKNLTHRMMNGAGDPLETWSRKNAAAMDQMTQMLSELKSADAVDLSMLAVASRHLSALAGSG